MVLFLIPFYHLSIVIFGHSLIQIFLQLVAGLDKGNFLGVFNFDFVFWSVLGVQFSHQSWFPLHLTGVFWEGYEFGDRHSSYWTML